MKNLKFNKYLISLISLIMVLVLLFNFYTFYQKKYSLMPEEERERIVSYMVTCYASEGFYPSSLEYLKDNYGLLLKEDRFIYYYDAFASNIMPDLIILEQFEDE